MTAQKLISWSPDAEAALRAWQVHAATAHPGLAMTYTPPGARSARPSDSAAIRGALAVATACRCAEHVAITITSSDRVLPGRVNPLAANPLRAMREAAGLSQSEMAARLGCSKRAVQLREARGTATPEMVERARKGCVK